MLIIKNANTDTQNSEDARRYVENKIEKQNKYFGRNNYITPVIFDGSDNQIGKIIKVKIKTSHQNTLFGSATKNMKAA